MKGIILEHNKNSTYVLDKEGGFHSVKGFRNKPIGAEIEFGVVIKKQFFKGLRVSFVIERFALAAACLTLIVCASSFTYQVNAVSCYVYIDINPSIELTINHLGRVLDSKGVNEDGKTLLDGHVIKGTMEDAIMTILQLAQDVGYMLLSGDEPTTSITLVPFNDGAAYEMLQRFSNLYTDNGLSGVSLYTCSKEAMAQAEALGISPAQLNNAGDLFSFDPSVDIDEIINISKKTIVDMILDSFIGDIIGRNK